MPVPSTGFAVGGVPLNREEFTADSIRELAKTARQAGLEEVEAIADRWLETGNLDEADYGLLGDLAKDAGGRYSGLNSQYWDRRREGASWKDLKPLEHEMGEVGAFLYRHGKLRDQLRVDTARAAVSAAAAASFSGPVGLVAAYAAWSNGTTWTGSSDRATRELLDTYQGYLSGEHPMITEGNKVEQVHRESLWQSIHQRFDEAIASAEAGTPVEIDAQYYELTSAEVVGKAAHAARVGNKLRINLDPCRLSFPDKDERGTKYYEVDDIPDKMRTIIQLASIRDADVGVSLFSVKEQLGSPVDLMHRKVLRSGETVLLSGMNANTGSGENLDAGYLIEGPAARRLTENLKRDIENSVGADIERIWSSKHFEGFSTETLKVGTRGLSAMLDVLAGPSPAGTPLPSVETRGDLDKLADKAGVKVDDMVDGDLDAMLSEHALVTLSDRGKGVLQDILRRAVALCQEPDNVERVTDITPPSGRKVGTTRVDIADQPTEREALMLEAINQADKFIYLPGFVVTRAVAAAIVARRDELAAKGQELDVRIVADPGIYPFGGTPNRYGIKFLEDHGIVPRWALLTRTEGHDRKVHAKQMITDKGEIIGSTNFSNKGLKDNWETSGFVHVDADNQASHDEAVAQFEDLWKNNTYELSTLDLSAYWNRYKPEVGKEFVIEDSRDGAVRKIIKLIEEYEEQTSAFIGEQASQPATAERVQALRDSGFSQGYATLQAVRESLGDRRYYETLNDLPAHRELEKLQESVARWKARG